MTLAKLVDLLSAKTVVGVDCGEISGFYAGDFLSRVIGKAPNGSAWFTIMNNVNVAGVASLAEIKVIVLCESVEPVQILVDKCKDNDIALIVTPLDVFNACVKVAE